MTILCFIYYIITIVIVVSITKTTIFPHCLTSFQWVIIVYTRGLKFSWIYGPHEKKVPGSRPHWVFIHDKTHYFFFKQQAKWQ